MIDIFVGKEEPVAYTIRTDYFPALRDSGKRPLSAIELFVVHDIESSNEGGAAEGAAAWFRNRQVEASAHLCIDNNSIQRCLDIDTVPWGAPHANYNGIHYELMGVARWTREQWMEHAKPTMDRCAWLLSRHHSKLWKAGIRVPLRKLTDAELRRGAHGITTHRQVTRVFGGGTHSDPGTGFPLDWMIDRARHYAGLAK